ncbi:MAG: hypothetical protein HWE35_15755 [Rhodobacteraceae bacterium]|nr:hypothetical protein [Paracoccaceae bacterium]
MAFVHPGHALSTVLSLFDQYPQGAFICEEGQKPISYASAIRLPGPLALQQHEWSAATSEGTGDAHDPAANWLYVSRMLLTAAPGHQSLGPELWPLLASLKSLAVSQGLEGLAVALPFPGYRERSGTAAFHRQCLADGIRKTGRPHLETMGPSVTINIALQMGFRHEAALPGYLGNHRNFALMVWRTGDADALP